MSPSWTTTIEPYARDLRRRAFGLPRSPDLLRVGIEVELLPLVDSGGARVPLRSSGGRSTLGVVREVARERGWCRERMSGGSPGFRIPGKGTLAFEPGGQLEFSSTPGSSVERVVEAAESVVESVAARAEAEGMSAATRGIDPELGPEDVRLELRTPRYRRLAAHLARIGSAGRRMMLQTAAIHVNLDLGPCPMERWWAANALVPYLISAFANSARYAGAETGFRSYRAQQWRELDPERTGVFGPDEDVDAYLDFALDAPAILQGGEEEPARPYREWIAAEDPGMGRWREHLTTLFPEVRPRGYLEIRALDALPPRWYAVPLVLLGGLLYDGEALRTLRELLDPADPEELVRGGKVGVRDPERARQCEELFDLALEGAARLGPDFAGGRALERTRAYRDRYPRRGRDPADDAGCAAGGPREGDRARGPAAS